MSPTPVMSNCRIRNSYWKSIDDKINWSSIRVWRTAIAYGYTTFETAYLGSHARTKSVRRPTSNASCFWTIAVPLLWTIMCGRPNNWAVHQLCDPRTEALLAAALHFLFDGTRRIGRKLHSNFLHLRRSRTAGSNSGLHCCRTELFAFCSITGDGQVRDGAEKTAANNQSVRGINPSQWSGLLWQSRVWEYTIFWLPKSILI